LLELSTLRALFNATNAFLIFTSNVSLLTFTTNNRSFTQKNINDNNHNSLLYTFYSKSILEAIDKLIEIFTKVELEVRSSFYNVEILEDLNSKDVEKIDFAYFSKSYSIFFDE